MTIKIVGNMPPEDFPNVTKRLVEDMVAGLDDLARDLKLDPRAANEALAIALTAHAVAVTRRTGMSRDEFLRGITGVWDNLTLRDAASGGRPN